ncbi:MAG: erg26, C-3 sterol dehydrogenase [Phylliscum demangeonii]|nr:MAG: erg26, C-3 sterol dehydrogenase [Phylliscum demangeonii]
MSARAAPGERLRLGRVLVVGGCGFLGHHIVKQLAHGAQRASGESNDHDHDEGVSHIYVLDLHTDRNRVRAADVRVAGPMPPAPPPPPIEYLQGDITSAAAVARVMAAVRPDVVMDTVSPPVTAPEAVLRRVNVDGTRVLLDAARAAGVAAFVYTSSASVVHDGTSDLRNVDERWPYAVPETQLEIYSRTKGPPRQAEGEAIVLAANDRPRPQQAGDRRPMLTVALRPAGIVGDGDPNLLPALVQALADGQTKFQLGANENLFDFTYVGNVAHAHILAARALVRHHQRRSGRRSPALDDDDQDDDDERVDGEPFFITNDSPVYFWDVPRFVWHALGDPTEPAQIWRIPERVGLRLATVIEWVMGLVGRRPSLTRQKVQYSCMTRYYSCDKAKRRLGYAPRVGLQDGLERAIRWMREQEAARTVAKPTSSD